MIFKLTLVAILAAAAITDAAIVRQPEKSPWTLLESLSAGSNIRRAFNGTWITDEEFYYTANDRSIHKFNAATDTDSIFVTSEFLERYDSGSFTLSPDNKKILVRYDLQEIFRHSFIAKYDVFDIETSSVTQIHKGEKLQYCAWSPIRDRLSYVYENNVYIHFEEGLETRITTEGVNGVIYNGIPDWVYEEEVLSSGSAMWWSPDGFKLVVGTFDDTQVHTFKYVLYGDAEDPEYQYPKEVDLKYPKPGTPNPIVSLRIFTLSNESLEPRSVKVTAPVNIVSEDHILQNVAWASNTDLLVTWLNRRQNMGTLQLCTTVGVCQEVKRFEEPNGWITKSTPQCFKSGNNCLFIDFIDNWPQIWNLDLTTGQNIWNSRGSFTVLKMYGYDETNNIIYYQATLPDQPHVYQVFGNDICLTCELRDIDGESCLSADASFSKNFSYYVATCSGPNPSYGVIFNTKTARPIKNWETNIAFYQRLETKLRPTVDFLPVTLYDGSTGIAKIQFPPNLDKRKKYPMIVVVYGGPGSVRVTNGFGIGFDTYLVTSHEVIYAAIDGRGTGNKGKNLLFSVNNHLGEHEVEDQIYVTESLQSIYPFIDKDRIGIWGWSYGGYMAAKTLANDSARVFQCGVSVAPVTSWLYYDTIYTERYMGLPTIEDNLLMYEESSVLEHVDNFRTHDFLLIHGSGDDNVHYQQSLILAKVLQKNDILFEQMTYPDEAHGISNLQPHLYNTMEQFWMNCLNLNAE